MKGYSAYAGGLALGFMMIPLIIRTTEEMLALVPNSYREAAFALGIPHWRIVLNRRPQNGGQGNHYRHPAGGGARGGRNRAPAFHRFGQPFLEPQTFRADCLLPRQIYTMPSRLMMTGTGRPGRGRWS